MACTHLFPLLIRVRAFAWSLQPHLSCRFYHYSLGTDGVFCQLLSNLIFFFLLHWSIPSTFPLSTLLLEEDIYSFQHASSCQHYCDLTLQCSYFHCKNNSNAATNNYHFIYRLSSVNNQDTLIKEWNISKSPPFLCWKYKMFCICPPNHFIRTFQINTYSVFICWK